MSDRKQSRKHHISEYLSQGWRITRIVEFEIECAYNKVEEGF
jgi:hypothetical protein